MGKRYFIACVALLGLGAALISCGKAKRPMFNMISSCDALSCHPSTPLMQSRPDTGRHGIHLDRGLICENCHSGYMDNQTHRNRVVDGSARDGVGIVYFDSLNLSAAWDTGARTCAGVECHGGGANPVNWYDDDGGECTVCHSSTSRIDPLTTGGSGVKGKHTAHVTGKGIGCTSCHEGYKSKATHMNGVYGRAETDPIAFFGGAYNGTAVSASFDKDTGVCSSASCHGGAGDINWYSDANGCTACHAPGGFIDPLTTNGSGDRGKHIAHVTKKGIECTVCHAGYTSNKNHGNGVYGRLETDPFVYYDSSNPSALWDNAGKVCNNMNCHGSVGWYATGPVDCVICHAPGNTGGAVDPLTTNGSGEKGKHVKHVSERGIACVKCHNGYTSQTSHANGFLDTSDPSVTLTMFDSTNPSGAWTGDTAPHTGSCASLVCHGPSTVDWYGTDPWVLPDCTTTCHTGVVGSRRQVTGTGGDFDKPSHHVINYATPSQLVVTAADCIVCHDMSNHMGGSVRVKNQDNAAQVITYDPSRASSLEPFCLSCHDSDGASGSANPLKPFSSSNTLGVKPNVAGNKIKDNWLKTYGHGTNGNHAQNDRLTCLGTGLPGTGCHGNDGAINAHGSMNQTIGTRRYDYKLIGGYYDEAMFSLCFTCHAVYPGKTKEDTLGVKAGGLLDVTYGWMTNCTNCHGIHGAPLPSSNPPYYTLGVTTHFADHDDPSNTTGLNDGQNPYVKNPASNNLHWLHLGMYDYRTRGGSMNLVVCSTCHSVHGSNTQYGAVHDEIGYTHGTDGQGNYFGQMKPGVYGIHDSLQVYPTYCDMSCHEKTPTPTHAWFNNITE